MKFRLNPPFFQTLFSEYFFNKSLFALLLAIVPIFSCYNLSAQTDEGQSGEDLGWVVPQDNGLTFSNPIVPSIARYAVARYESSAQVFLVVKSPLGQANVPISYRRTDQPSIFTTVNMTTTTTGGTITGLPLDKDFEIFAADVNGVSQKIAHINTKKENSEMILLPANIYGPISKWLQDPQGVDLYTFVASLPGLHFIEKSHFIQEFFYGGGPLKNTEIGRVPDMPPTTENGGCLCRPLQLTVAEAVVPILGQAPADEFGNGEYISDARLAEDGTTTTQFGGGKGKKWYAYSHDGPAKYQQVWIETRRCVGGWNSMKIDDSGPGPQHVSGNTATLSYSFVCVGLEAFQPSDCPCERPRSVNVSWRYSAETSVDANLRSGGCWNGRGTTGMAVDMAAVMYGYSDMGPNDLPLPLDAGVTGTVVGCDANFDEGMLAGNIAAAVLYGIKAIKALGDNPIDQLWGLYYTPKAIDAVEDLFSDEYMEHSGVCGQTLNPCGQLLYGQKDLELKINRTLVVTLVSSSQLEVKGFGKYRSNARILSSYGLTGTLAQSEPVQTGPNCCSLGSGVYSLSAYCPGLTRGSLQSWARDRFMANALQNVPGINVYNMTGEWGYRGGGERPDCALVIVNARSDGAESALPSTSSEGYLEVRGTAVWLFKQPTQQPWQFDLIDVNGRLIHSFQGEHTDTELMDLQLVNVPAGLYFGQLRDKTGVKNIRLTKSN